MFIYLELPKFRKRLEELTSHSDKWLYVLKHLPYLEGKPAVLQEGVFEKLFRVAELAKLSAEQAAIYQESVKHYRDIENSLDTAEQRGREEGRCLEKIAIAKQMLEAGEPIEKIMKWTGLDIDALDVLQ